MRLLTFCLGLCLLLNLAAAQNAPRLIVAYPPDGHSVAYDHIILEGSVSPGARLQISGQSAEVAPDGLYTLWWPLRPGVNTLRLVTAVGGQSSSRTIKVTRRVPLPAQPTAIRSGTLEPSGRMEFWDVANDSPDERQIGVRFEGSPGGQATFRLGSGAAQPMREAGAGVYIGTLSLPSGGQFDQAAITFTLTGKSGKSVSMTAPGRVSTGTGPATATQNPGTVRGLGLDEAAFSVTTLDGTPLLYPREGTRFVAVGRQGDDLRVRLAPGLSALVTAAQVTLTKGVPVPALPGVVSLDLASANDLRLRLPLGARVPFGLTQTLTQTGSRLDLTLYGLSGPPVLGELTDPLLAGVSSTPLGLEVSRLSLDLASGQPWGFYATYEGNDLILTVRRAPAPDPLSPLGASPLAGFPLTGRVITLDPGHGGSNLGGAGLLGLSEKGLTLPVALRAAELLRAQGATVNVTRERDVFVGLSERGLQAEQTRADLLVSLHYNALPDGRDPRGIRGPEVYYTWPQAEALARTILDSLRRNLPELGRGAGLKPGANLALTRPSTQISLLVEMAYLTDAANVRLMNSPEGQERLAQAIAVGIADFYTQSGWKE